MIYYLGRGKIILDKVVIPRTEFRGHNKREGVSNLAKNRAKKANFGKIGRNLAKQAYLEVKFQKL